MIGNSIASRFRRRVVAAGAGLAVVASSIVGSAILAPTASAAVSPVQPGSAKTVTTDALPTVQINGVVWSQAVLNKTVYAGGNFTQARPAGAAAGTNQTPRSHLLAYDITTGNLITSFAPTLNGQVLAVAKSPDGSRLYVGGDFTTVNGASRSRIAAFNTTNGQLITTFAPPVGYQVRAIVATSSTVYIGGSFAGVGSQVRGNLAAFNASNGALLNWAPTANRQVNALALSADGGKVLAGGAFETVNGTASRGLAKLDASTGALDPWPVTISNAGADSAITSLSVEGDAVYGTAYHYGPGGNMEGPWSASVSSGQLRWAADCHGDTYSNFVAEDTVYTVGHSHYCANVGGFPQNTPWKFQFGMGWSKDATGQNLREVHGYPSWEGQPSPSIRQWLPTLTQGTFTGQSQAGWSITGNSDYVVVGGEFPRVNGTAQQGLVRFAVKPIAPAKRGPVFQNNQLVPTLQALPNGTVKVGWLAGHDPDDATLDYEVVRSPGGVVKTITAASSWWNMPALSYRDTAVTPGQTYSYQIRATDSSGNKVFGTNKSITVPASVTLNPYATKVLADGAKLYWPLDDAAGTGQLADSAGGNAGVRGTGATSGAAGAIAGNTGMTIANSDAGRSYASGSDTAPTEMSAQVWFKTSTAGGRLLGFSDVQTPNSARRDRQLYIDNTGRVAFGVRAAGVKALASTKSYNDNQWHQAVATMAGGKAKLYVDGVLVAQRGDVVDPEVYVGYWRLSGDTISDMPNAGAVNFNGSLDEVSVYPSALTAAQIQAQYVASGRTAATVPAPADPYGAAVFGDEPDLYWRLGESTGTAAADAGPVNSPGTYNGGHTKGQAGAITGTTNASVKFDGSTGFVAGNNVVSNPTVFSVESWFKTGSTRGGKIIGFGNAKTGLSGSYDRHVYLQDDGRLVFGVYNGVTNTITTQQPYNDNKWHHVVATLSGGGMKVYVDGRAAGSNPNTTAQNYNGYWRVGADRTWGSTSAYLDGTIDEAAVYGSVLNEADALRHFKAGGGVLPNLLPTASFTDSKKDLKLDVDASASADSDGTIESYAWDFGDGQTETGKTASHNYADAGTFAVKLTVTDDKGGKAEVTKQITVTAPPPNVEPVAAFQVTVKDLKVDVDASGSTDGDGTIESYAWDFGDDKTADTKVASHSYDEAGDYEISLTVTDDDGAEHKITKQVSVTEPANEKPKAVIDAAVENLTVNVDGRSSSDTDGEVKTYAWEFGDDATGDQAEEAHTYNDAGTYTIKLTVTDNRGGTDSVTKQVTVEAAPTTIAEDGFGRSEASGFGTADHGGKWTPIGSAGNFSVSDGAGKIKMTAPGSGPRIYLDEVSAQDLDMAFDLAFDKAATGGGSYAIVSARRVGNTEYRVKARALPTSVQVVITKVVDGTETTLGSSTVAGLTYEAGDVLRVRSFVAGNGTTELKAKVWKVSAAEPAAWQVSTTDDTAALQRPGSAGLQAYLSGSATNAPVVASIDNLVIDPHE